MTKKLNEDTLTEQSVIEWLKEMGYDYEFGPDLAPETSQMKVVEMIGIKNRNAEI